MCQGCDNFVRRPRLPGGDAWPFVGCHAVLRHPSPRGVSPRRNPWQRRSWICSSTTTTATTSSTAFGRLAALAELELHSYVLLGNHYHTILCIPDARVSRALQRLHTEYSRDHNRRHGRKSHLFRRSPVRGVGIESDDDLMNDPPLYFARNPVEANLVSDPLDWPWGMRPSSRRPRAHADPARR